MSKRKVQLYSAGCPICEKAIEDVKSILNPDCDLEILDTNNPEVANQAVSLGVNTVPATVVDGVLADCCNNSGVDILTLKSLGIGKDDG
ncbi:MAG TPA: hypothetical protein VGB30_09950 [bacterium]|jgi:hypothetical protein